MPRILLTNDDGLHAPGIAVLRRALDGLGDVVTIAPAVDTSGVARGVTIGKAVRVTDRVFGEGWPGLAVEGTPVDCVRVALLGVLSPRPDLVVSGVNYGSNMGNDVTYSGTVGAVLEAALHTVPGVAFAVESREPQYLDQAVPLLRDLVARLLRQPLPVGVALNVNLPDLPAADIRGLRVTSLGGASRHDRVVLDAGAGVPGEHWMTCQRAPLESWAVTDFHAVADGYVSLTPVHCELTSREGLAALSSWHPDTQRPAQSRERTSGLPSSGGPPAATAGETYEAAVS